MGTTPGGARPVTRSPDRAIGHLPAACCPLTGRAPSAAFRLSDRSASDARGRVPPARGERPGGAGARRRGVSPAATPITLLRGTAGQLAGPDSARQVALNITALNTVVGAFADQLVESATAHGCADLVNTASIAGRQPCNGFPACSASKAYVVHPSATSRSGLCAKNVSVPVVEPGIVAGGPQGLYHQHTENLPPGSPVHTLRYPPHEAAGLQ
ncbi:SDR family NAD(P)-dependent oxidoreductase [Streptomyces sp. NPDC007157]|uniref:SDR family NAD(P)-dependent oxidoreductase n=1 Tax=Streptomyces sp. NPDC007157 TaxID=3154681 RepID=UPI0033CBE7A6